MISDVLFRAKSRQENTRMRYLTWNCFKHSFLSLNNNTKEGALWANVWLRWRFPVEWQKTCLEKQSSKGKSFTKEGALWVQSLTEMRFPSRMAENVSWKNSQTRAKVLQRKGPFDWNEVFAVKRQKMCLETYAEIFITLFGLSFEKTAKQG